MAHCDVSYIAVSQGLARLGLCFSMKVIIHTLPTVCLRSRTSSKLIFATLIFATLCVIHSDCACYAAFLTPSFLFLSAIPHSLGLNYFHQKILPTIRTIIPGWDSYLGEGAFYTSFSIKTPGFLIFLWISACRFYMILNIILLYYCCTAYTFPGVYSLL